MTMDNDIDVEREREFLALILNKPELIEITQIKPNYLRTTNLSNLYSYLLECYKDYKTLSPIKIIEKHKDFEPILYTELLTNTLVILSNWKEQFEILEQDIIKNHKKNIYLYCPMFF